MLVMVTHLTLLVCKSLPEVAVTVLHVEVTQIAGKSCYKARLICTYAAQVCIITDQT